MASASEAVNGPYPPSSATLKNAEEAIRTAFRTTKQPTTEMYAVLADILEDWQLDRRGEGSIFERRMTWPKPTAMRRTFWVASRAGETASH